MHTDFHCFRKPYRRSDRARIRQTFACGRYSGFSPSMSRQLISLPTVYPSISRCIDDQPKLRLWNLPIESLLMHTCSLGPLIRAAVDLKNISGLLSFIYFVIITNRYWSIALHFRISRFSTTLICNTCRPYFRRFDRQEQFELRPLT